MPREERIPWDMDRICLVTGSRRFLDARFVERVLEYHHPSLVVHGGATGVDTFADRWAYRNGIPRTIFAISPQQWERFGKAEGHYRNTDMSRYLLAIVHRDEHGEPEWEESGIEGLVFPGQSGTHDMLDILVRLNIPWWDYRNGQFP